MRLLSRFFGGKKQSVVVDVEQTECPHSVLVPRWDSVQDMGIAEKATRYMCEACKEMFEPEEAIRLRETLVDRLVAIAAAAEESERAAGNA